MKLIIAGSRDVEVTSEQITEILSGWMGLGPHNITEVVSGGARGADACGERWAQVNGRWCVRMPADWDVHGRAAGPIRNASMADYADVALVFWDGRSKGTFNMIYQMAKHGKPCLVVGWK